MCFLIAALALLVALLAGALLDDPSHPRVGPAEQTFLFR